MTYTLHGDSNFVAYCGYNLDYSTHTGEGFEGDSHDIDEDCILHIYKGKHNVAIEEELWAIATNSDKVNMSLTR